MQFTLQEEYAADNWIPKQHIRCVSAGRIHGGNMLKPVSFLRVSEFFYFLCVVVLLEIRKAIVLLNNAHERQMAEKWRLRMKLFSHAVMHKMQSHSIMEIRAASE